MTTADDSAANGDNGDFASWRAGIAAAVESRLRQALPRSPRRLAAAMQSSVLASGKRLRPLLAFAAAEATDAPPTAKERVIDAACAVELTHCYSLIHDDLPSMDNAQTRRGRPACHIEHGEATAILAGDCLQSLAFELLAKSGGEAAAILARAAGAAGMGGGQSADLALSAKAPANGKTEATLESIHRRKTGALFCCALRLGLLCGRLPPAARARRAFDIYGRELGVLFQIGNDLSDIESDRARGCANYALILGEKKARARAESARARALDALSALPGGAPIRLRHIMGEIHSRLQGG